MNRLFASTLLKIILLSTIITICFSCVESTPPQHNKVRETITEFYNWYIQAIKDDKDGHYKPSFVMSEDSMTTLQMGAYSENLKTHHFAESLIVEELSSYETCINSLSVIPFETFQTDYTNLDQFEDLGCNFGNNYRWIGGQEIGFDLFRVEKISISEGSAKAKVIFFADGEPSQGFKKVFLEKVDDGWEITRID